MTAIKAIETRYAGCRFRSRLEARWAVFFDALGIEWQYEPEGFELPSGWYLPDFLVTTPAGQAWIEVKPTEPDEPDPRWGELRGASNIGVYVFAEIPDPRKVQEWEHYVAVCPTCSAVDLFPMADASWMPCHGANLEGVAPPVHTGRHPRILAAYEAARSARFEHGENGGRR